MEPQQRALAALNVLGGTAVLASYALAFAISPEIRSGLWGGVPDGLRPVYTLCMGLAATGYFPFTYLLVFRIDPQRLRHLSGLSYNWILAAYALVLIPSAAWLPLTAELLSEPSVVTWWLVRAVLGAVALGSSLLLFTLVRVARRGGGSLAWTAALGCLPFWVQTAVLDAVVWPAFFAHP